MNDLNMMFLEDEWGTLPAFNTESISESAASEYETPSIEELQEKIDDIIFEPGRENTKRIEDVMVTHPPHYQSETGLEVIDVIEAFTFDLKGIEAVDVGNVLKYICRWKNKNGLQDLNKAKWYLEHLIAYVEKMEKENDE